MKKNGFSLIEILISLSIVVIFLISAFLIYKDVLNQHKANKVIEELNSIPNQVSEIVNNNGLNTYNRGELTSIPFSGQVFIIENLKSLFPIDTKSKRESSDTMGNISPFGGHVKYFFSSSFGAQGKTNVLYDSTLIIIDMIDYDIKSCVFIANSQLSNSKLNSISIGKYNFNANNSDVKNLIVDSCNSTDQERKYAKLQFNYNI